MIRLVFAFALLVPAIASASPADAEKPWHPGRFAIASTGIVSTGIGGSFYIAPNKHLVVRLNAVTYKDQKLSPAAGVLVAALDGGDETDREGRIYDVGVGGMVFPLRLWDGPCSSSVCFIASERPFELQRPRSTSRTTARRAAFTRLSALGDHGFVAIAAGAAYGYAHVSGAHIDEDPFHQFVKPFEFSRWETTFECYLRERIVIGG